jgi:hypothetical protein
MTDRDAIISLEAEFPGWLIYRGCSDKMCHGRHHTPGADVLGEDWVDLRDEIRGWIGRNANS